MTLTDAIKEFLDWLAGGIVVGTLLKLLPAIAAVMSIVWTGVRLYDRFKGKHHGD